VQIKKVTQNKQKHIKNKHIIFVMYLFQILKKNILRHFS
jgi:hypothetical protein